MFHIYMSRHGEAYDKDDGEFICSIYTRVHEYTSANDDSEFLCLICTWVDMERHVIYSSFLFWCVYNLVVHLLCVRSAWSLVYACIYVSWLRFCQSCVAFVMCQTCMKSCVCMYICFLTEIPPFLQRILCSARRSAASVGAGELNVFNLIAECIIFACLHVCVRVCVHVCLCIYVYTDPHPLLSEKTSGKRRGRWTKCL